LHCNIGSKKKKTENPTSQSPRSKKSKKKKSKKKMGGADFRVSPSSAFRMSPGLLTSPGGRISRRSSPGTEHDAGMSSSRSTGNVAGLAAAAAAGNAPVNHGTTVDNINNNNGMSARNRRRCSSAGSSSAPQPPPQQQPQPLGGYPCDTAHAMPHVPQLPPPRHPPVAAGVPVALSAFSPIPGETGTPPPGYPARLEAHPRAVRGAPIAAQRVLDERRRALEEERREQERALAEAEQQRAANAAAVTAMPTSSTTNQKQKANNIDYLGKTRGACRKCETCTAYVASGGSAACSTCGCMPSKHAK
jgi:hypothetical protein